MIAFMQRHDDLSQKATSKELMGLPDVILRKVLGFCSQIPSMRAYDGDHHKSIPKTRMHGIMVDKTQPFQFNRRLHRLAVEAVYDVNVFSVACGPAVFDAEDDLSVMLEDWEQEPETLLRDIAPDLKARYNDIRHVDLHFNLTSSKGTPWTLKDCENRAALITLLFNQAQEIFPNVKTVSLWLEADPMFDAALHMGIPDTMNVAADMAADDPRVMQPALLCLLYSILDDAFKTFSIHSVAFSRWDTAKGWMLDLKHLTDIADLVKVMSQPGNETLQFRVKTCAFA